MYRLITDTEQIDKLQKIFQDVFIDIATKQYLCNIGYKGEVHKDSIVYWSESLGIWACFNKLENRYWNALGTVKPKYDGYLLGITCEINFPYNGVDRRIAGAFVVDDEGSIYVVHRGNIGGGRKGISKSLFTDNYKGQWITLGDGTKVAMIGKLGDTKLPSYVANFVKEIERIKNILY